ncbi:hypothetical protein NDU88_006716 [Pleurodeles waltl]|uniref:Uncharacterized protein n=1 Tax=Pleurodeles waltl TaxID=8319 RepID=A0AAV7N3U9_PLEWA|nr:hypothetical protein NDU88_006716 [Pleurodeles waltl]
MGGSFYVSGEGWTGPVYANRKARAGQLCQLFTVFEPCNTWADASRCHPLGDGEQRARGGKKSHVSLRKLTSRISRNVAFSKNLRALVVRLILNVCSYKE